MTTVALPLEKRWRGLSAREVATLLLSSALLVAAMAVRKGFLRGVPGHTGLLWLPPLFLAAAGVRRVGAPTLVAVAGSLVAFPIVGAGPLTFPSVIAGGIALDLIGWGRDRLSLLPWAVAAGVVAHLVKFAVHSGLALAFTVEADSLRRGLAYVLGLHAAFGAGAGFLGWCLVRGVRRAPQRVADEPPR